VKVVVNSDMPATIAVGQATGAFNITAISTVPATAAQGLALVGATSIEGSAVSGDLVTAPNLNLPVNVPITIPNQPVPASGAFDINATGSTPSLTFGASNVGTAKIFVNTLTLTLIARKADGTPVDFGAGVSDPNTKAFTSNCTLDAGQPTQLHQFEITAATTTTTTTTTPTSQPPPTTTTTAPPPPGTPTATQDITTTIGAGALVISVDNTHVTLPSPVLAPDGTKLTTTGALNAITVTDTRAGNPGWTVSGQVSAFADGQSHTINPGNLGWTPKVLDKAATQNITAGPGVNPADAIAPGATPPAGTGLATGRTLATAAALGGTGTAHLGGDLALNVPTSTVAGTYTATLTLTAI
jgi:hypothetical protein